MRVVECVTDNRVYVVVECVLPTIECVNNHMSLCACGLGWLIVVTDYTSSSESSGDSPQFSLFCSTIFFT